MGPSRCRASAIAITHMRAPYVQNFERENILTGPVGRGKSREAKPNAGNGAMDHSVRQERARVFY